MCLRLTVCGLFHGYRVVAVRGISCAACVLVQSLVCVCPLGVGPSVLEPRRRGSAGKVVDRAERLCVFECLGESLGESLGSGFAATSRRAGIMGRRSDPPSNPPTVLLLYDYVMGLVCSLLILFHACEGPDSAGERHRIPSQRELGPTQ